MQTTPLFKGLTREVTFAGLPMLYVVVLVKITILTFILIGSFTLLLAISGMGYLAMRGLAAYDPRLINVLVSTMQKTRMHPGLMSGAGVVYRA